MESKGKESDKPLQVKVLAVLEDGKLVVEVRDDGIGISEERLQEIMHSLNAPEDDESHRIGLSNVHHRLQTLYGTPG